MSVMAVVMSALVNAQLYDRPESITYDAGDDSYFVSNVVGNGTILKLDKSSNVRVFVSGYVSFIGIKLHDGVIYASENRKEEDDWVRGFNKVTGKEVFALRIPGTKQLNDIEFDGKGNLYVSDRMGHKVFRVNVRTRTYEVIDSTIDTPNGIFFDKKKNRLLICNTVEKCNVYEYDLSADKPHARVLLKTDFPHLDGITMDEAGNLYLTSWSLDWKTSRLLRYDGREFKVILENHKGMADIEFNPYTNSIDIANLLDDSVEHFRVVQ